jgi:hypothetical protein
MSQNLRDKYNYYEMKGINMQDNRYVQQSNADRLESESAVVIMQGLNANDSSWYQLVLITYDTRGL